MSGYLIALIATGGTALAIALIAGMHWRARVRAARR